MPRTIQYAIETETGIVISRVGSEIAVPVLQFAEMKPENNFRPTYLLEKMNVHALCGIWNHYKWTKKISVDLKNRHREFWGFKPLQKREQENGTAARLS